MMYRVIRYFTDLQDNDHPYNVGDVFPRQGVEVSTERIAELASFANRQKTPLIESYDEPDAEAPAEVAEDTAEDAETTEESPAVEEKPKRRKRKAETE